MTGTRTAPHGASLEALLSRFAARRLVLIGPDGPTLRRAVEWVARQPSVSLLRAADGSDAGPADLLVCEQADLLPSEVDSEVAALVPHAQALQALGRGWAPVSDDLLEQVLLRRADSQWPSRELSLAAYGRLRFSLSNEIHALNDGERTPAQHPVDVPAQPRGIGVLPHRRARAEVSIIVPVYNAAPELRRCIAALGRHTTYPSEVVIVDDASPDPAVADVLTEASELSGVRVLRNAFNLGFTGTVNRALRATDGDIVLLNSDTEVGPRWLEHLARAARSRARVATVTAVSDNAGAFAVPDPGKFNPTPLALDCAGVARLLAQTAIRPVEAPTGNGFCLYIRREAIDALGPFDAAGFPRGYGEENDFCMRALRAGWTHLVDGRTFVHHVREASFGDERQQLAHAARKRLDARYPEYTELVRDFVGGDLMASLRAQVQAAYREPRGARPRILFVIHEGGGGTWIANLELMRALQGEWEPLVLTSDRRTLRLSRAQGAELVPLQEWTLAPTIQVTDFSRPDYAEVVRDVLEQYEIELVHIRHLFKHTFDAPRVAATLSVPVVFSFHDFYFTCPSVNLLDDHDVYCGARCTPGDGECRVPDAGLDRLPHLKHSFVYEWREEVEAMLRDVDAFVTTSAHARQVHRRALPTLSDRPFELIEHGRTLRQRGGIAVTPRPDEPVRILVIANIDVHKGAEYVRAMLRADTRRQLEFHFLGSVPDAYTDLGVCHGSFASGELPERAEAIAPSFVGCFSIAPETYSHALTEAWAMGIPVVATDLGAFGERIRAHGGGQLLPLDDPGEAVRRICALADDPAAYARLREEASIRSSPSVADMTDAFADLYRCTLDDRRVLVSPPGGRGPARLRRGVIRLLAVVSGAHGVHPGSTYVRVVQRYRHPSVSAKLSLALRYGDQDPLRAPADLALVQRTALHPAQTEEFIAALDERSVPLVLDLDDHLLIKGSGDAAYGPHRDSVTALINAARLVIVSTTLLADALRGSAREIAVVPNLIDERLFLGGVEERPRAAPGERPVQIVYVGSPTHAGDLALLRPVMAALASQYPGQFELNVVGVEAPGPEQEWYTRVVVPDRCKPYPEFVRWLREKRPRWDLAVAPLLDDEFNRYKSDLKYLEYAALGLPAIFSDREPYATVEHGSTGLKVGDSIEEWIEAVTRAAADPRRCERMAENAFRQVTSNRLLRHGSDELLELVCGLLDDHDRGRHTAQARPMMSE